MFQAARRREAANVKLSPADVDPQEVLEERRVVPVKEFGKVVVRRTTAAARQWEDPPGEASGTPAVVRVLVPLSRRLDSESLSPAAAPSGGSLTNPFPGRTCGRIACCRRRASLHVADSKRNRSCLLRPYPPR